MSKNLPSPLLLERSHFLSTQVEAAKEFEQTEEITVNIQSSCGVHHEDPKLWRVELEVGFGKSGKAIQQPYFGKVRVELYLRVHPSFPNERIPDLIKVNGVSLAYGMIRESVANLTGRGPHGVFLLPSVSFIEQKKSASPSKKISATPLMAKTSLTPPATSKAWKAPRASASSSSKAAKKSPASTP